MEKKFFTVCLCASLVFLGLVGDALAADRDAIPIEVLEAFGPGPLPPLEVIRDSGLVKGGEGATKAIGGDPEDGWIPYWLVHGDGFIAGIDEDIIGETSLEPLCEGDRVGEEGNTRNTYWSSYWEGKVDTDEYDQIWDGENCENISGNYVRYFYTRIRGYQGSYLLSLGHDAGFKVFFNGEQVYRGRNGVWAADAEEVPVTFIAGWNDILLKQYVPNLNDDSERAYASIRFLELDGTTPLRPIQSFDGWCEHGEGDNWVYAGGAADLEGAQGSVWASDLRLTNIYPFRLDVTVDYFREDTVRTDKATTPDAREKFLLAPYASRTYERVLQSLFNLQEDQKGMIAVRGFEGWDAAQGAVSMRTYNRSGGATYGMTVPFYEWDYGYSCCSQYLMGLRNGPNFRTNLAMSPGGVVGDKLEFTVTLWDPVTGQSASQDFEGWGYFQLNDIFAKVGLGNLVTNDAVAYINWSSTDNYAEILFTASVNDNTTSDPSFVGRGPSFSPPIND